MTSIKVFYPKYLENYQGTTFVGLLILNMTSVLTVIVNQRIAEMSVQN